MNDKTKTQFVCSAHPSCVGYGDILAAVREDGWSDALFRRADRMVMIWTGNALQAPMHLSNEECSKLYDFIGALRSANSQTFNHLLADRCSVCEELLDAKLRRMDEFAHDAITPKHVTLLAYARDSEHRGEPISKARIIRLLRSKGTALVNDLLQLGLIYVDIKSKVFLTDFGRHYWLKYGLR